MQIPLDFNAAVVAGHIRIGNTLEIANGLVRRWNTDEKLKVMTQSVDGSIVSSLILLEVEGLDPLAEVQSRITDDDRHPVIEEMDDDEEDEEDEDLHLEPMDLGDAEEGSANLDEDATRSKEGQEVRTVIGPREPQRPPITKHREENKRKSNRHTCLIAHHTNHWHSRAPLWFI